MAEYIAIHAARKFALANGETADLIDLASSSIPADWDRVISLNNLAIGTPAFVHAMGCLRRGVVVKTTPTKVHISLTTEAAIRAADRADYSRGVRIQTVVADPNYVYIAPENNVVPQTTAMSLDEMVQADYASSDRYSRQVIASAREELAGLTSEQMISRKIRLPQILREAAAPIFPPADDVRAQVFNAVRLASSPEAEALERADNDLIGCPQCEETMEVSTEDADATLSEMYRHIFSRHADYDQARTYELLAKVREIPVLDIPAVGRLITLDQLSRETTGSAVVKLLEKVWARIREDHPELPDVVIVTGSGMAGDNKWGHFRPEGWAAKGEFVPEANEHSRIRLGEMFMAGETLARGAGQVLQTMLHEASHCLARVRGIQDTSRQGRWHNKEFLKLAQEMGLEHRGEKTDKRIGYSQVTVTEATTVRYADLMIELDREIHLHVPLPSWLGGDAGQGGEAIGPRPVGTGSSTAGVKLVCSCEEPNIVRASRKVADRTVITCSVCGSNFTEAAA